MKKLIAITFVLFFFSCSEKLIKKPDDLIPKDQMVNILNDMAILNAAKNANESKLIENNIEPTNYIFEKYGIDSLQFVNSDNYYASLPREYEEIYKQVEELLDKEKERVAAEKETKDSLLQQSKLKNSPIKKRTSGKVKDTLP
ncbi:DUF4296 domain-containing protein [Maribacter luteus]|uniref:DUF4296 domain-containing protein n=1 Tax=Maribacter luteus TaxID=2594478 RepID=UPI0024909000|nr:DUF4296 domain-containing protein [Maribacter luteus]